MVKVHMYQKEIQKICTHQHLTVDEIFEQLQKKFPKAGRSTVYRNVEEMTQNSKLKKLSINNKKSVYETNIGIHAHLIDQNTGTIQDIEIPNSEFSFIPPDFITENIEITIYGQSTE